MSTVDTSRIASYSIPPVFTAGAQPIRQTPEAQASDKENTNARRDSRGARFRAALNAAATSGVGTETRESASGTASATDAKAAPQRADRRPSADVELDGKESENLYRAAQARAAIAEKASAADEQDSEDSDANDAGSIPVHQFLSVTRQYAQRFFSVGAGFASRGDSLELTA